MIHTHVINPYYHADFLAQNRQDPITGEALQANDRIVFCAHCQSAFLEESWEYLGGEHCGQKNTLENFPKQQALTLAWKELDGILYQVKTSTHKEVSSFPLMAIVSLLIGLSQSAPNFLIYILAFGIYTLRTYKKITRFT
ncbi:MAG: hypothetical protein AAF740_14860, partial [Bacteroidota bacterium]